MPRRSAHSVAQVPARSQSSIFDVEGDDSQRVLALNSLLQTPKTNHKELQDLKTKMAKDQQELKTLLEQRMRQAEEASTRRRNELTKAVFNALKTPNHPVQGTPPTLDDTEIARNAVFKSIAGILTASEHLVGEYNRLDRKIVGMRDAEPEGIAEAWTEDVEKAARLLKIGAKSAIRNVKKVLGADVEVDNMEDLREEDQGMKTVEEMELNYELHTSLQYAERGVKRMVKCLSIEGGH